MKTCLLLVAIAACHGDRGTPTDSELRDLVGTHLEELTTLRTMIAADAKLGVVGDDKVGDCWRFRDGWSCSSVHVANEEAMLRHVGLSENRWRAYRRVFADIGAHSASVDSAGDVTIGIYAAGIVTSGVSKDLEFTQQPPTPLVGDTDRDSGKWVYASAGAGWYIARARN